MRKVSRSEILDLGAYEQVRERFRGRMIEEKRHRRVAVGPSMTFIFENHDTVLLQIQEMLRTERISAEPAIAHEIETYNDLVPGTHELSATLMLEFDDPAVRARMSTELADLEANVFLRLGDREYPATFRPLPGEEPGRLPSVNYVRFALDASAAERLGGDKEAVLVVRHPAYAAEGAVPDATRRALRADLLSA
jgi:hypothetical protein